ncbi:hypothetical protein DQ819_26575, partial [Salmonella enterica subsp. enterica serovar Mikawasima]|nr:hypothetical protein [Salmonella enterica subsp. enterica serovar Mikawasima]
KERWIHPILSRISENSTDGSLYLWISLCTNGYKAGFCCGMQQTINLMEIKGCQPARTPYNAPPSTRNM